MSMRVVTVFGGTGFLGRRVVRHLRNCGFSVRIASRHPDSQSRIFWFRRSATSGGRNDIHDERTVADALADAYGAVNAVSLTTVASENLIHGSRSVANQNMIAA